MLRNKELPTRYARKAHLGQKNYGRRTLDQQGQLTARLRVIIGYITYPPAKIGLSQDLAGQHTIRGIATIRAKKEIVRQNKIARVQIKYLRLQRIFYILFSNSSQLKLILVYSFRNYYLSSQFYYYRISQSNRTLLLITPPSPQTRG